MTPFVHLRSVLVPICLLTLIGCSEEKYPIPKSDPEITRGGSLRGYKIRGNGMLAKNDEVFWLQQAVKGAPKNGEANVGMPAEVERLKTTVKCKFPQVTDAQKLSRVHLHEGWTSSNIFSVTDKEIEKRALDLIKTIGSDDGKLKVSNPTRYDRIPVANVVITASAKPHYLVLTSQTPIIWNIQATPHATIDQVVILADGENVGIANLDPSVPVAALTSEELKRCKIVPRRTPRGHWSFVQNTKKYATPSTKNTLARNNRAGNAHTKWFIAAFGRLPRDREIGDFSASNLLIGPVPRKDNQRHYFKPFSESKLQITENYSVFIGSSSDYKRQNKSAVIAKAEKLLGRSISASIK